jgi:predicted polyphosphate/ATP-dependent NAD kinase
LSTTADDYREAANKIEECKADLIPFVGGDGTTCNIIDAVDMCVPILGVPMSVKMFKGVFASTPRAISQLTQVYRR